METKLPRLWEIDALRGVAICMMVSYHCVYDLDFMLSISLGLKGMFWSQFVNLTASTFLFLVGVSMTLRRSRSKTMAGFQAYKPFLKRGLQVLGCGLVITVVTWFAYPEKMIRFGILHLIGMSILVSYPLLKHKWLNFLLAGVVFALTPLTYGKIASHWGWYWLGIAPEHGGSFDYLPMLPWYGPVLLGVFMGNVLYPLGMRRFAMPDWSSTVLARRLTWLGRHSLVIYLVHQPVLLGVLLGIRALRG